MSSSWENEVSLTLCLQELSNENINWKCKKCGNNWVTAIKNRTRNKSNCKRCMGGIISRNEYRLFCELSLRVRAIL